MAVRSTRRVCPVKVHASFWHFPRRSESESGSMQREAPGTITILMADDDADDRMMAADAMRESRLGNTFRCVEDGQELMDYLTRRGKYAVVDAPRPGLILLDLNMPRKDGRQALEEIKADPHLHRIPVVVLTTSAAEEDVYR